MDEKDAFHSQTHFVPTVDHKNTKKLYLSNTSINTASDGPYKMNHSQSDFINVDSSSRSSNSDFSDTYNYQSPSVTNLSEFSLRGESLTKPGNITDRQPSLLSEMSSHLDANIYNELLNRTAYFKDIFQQLSEKSGYMMRDRFEEYLRYAMALPSAVHEMHAFSYSPNISSHGAFPDGKTRINIKEFINLITSEPGLPSLMWLPILNRLPNVENVFHPVKCESCHRESFIGFRYKCQRCNNYQLCQECFWRGKTSGSHTNDHEMKEFSSYKSGRSTSHGTKKLTSEAHSNSSVINTHFDTNVKSKLTTSNTGVAQVPHNQPICTTISLPSSATIQNQGFYTTAYTVRKPSATFHSSPSQPYVQSETADQSIGLTNSSGASLVSTYNSYTTPLTTPAYRKHYGRIPDDNNNPIIQHSQRPRLSSHPKLGHSKENFLNDFLEEDGDDQTSGRIEDEHRLIARYASRLAANRIHAKKF